MEKKKLTVTAEISTKDRYFTTLPLAVLAIAHQTVVPDVLLIYDDGEHRDLRAEPSWNSLFALLSARGIYWEFNFGQRKGQVANHQKAIERADTDLIWRVDDDDTPEPNVLETLVRHFEDPTVGAASGLVWIPGGPTLSHRVCSTKIEDVWSRPNIQWSDLPHVAEVDHLNNTFVFRKSAATHGYCMDLSPVGHGEETLFTHGIKRNGFKLLVDPAAKIWHLRSPTGGIRSYADTKLWESDSAITLRKFAEWGVSLSQYQLFVLDNGLGDHFAFKSILPEIRRKYAGKKLQLAVCYPEVFKDEKDIELMSLVEAWMVEGNRDRHSVYKWMWDHNWKGRLADAFRGMWL